MLDPRESPSWEAEMSESDDWSLSMRNELKIRLDDDDESDTEWSSEAREEFS